MNTASITKEATGVSIIFNNENHFFGGNLSPHFMIRNSVMSININGYSFPLKTTDTITLSGTPFAGTLLQLKAALITLFATDISAIVAALTNVIVSG